MKCKDCKSREPRVVGGRLQHFCNAVKEPFVIVDIEHECTEYPDKKDDVGGIEGKYMKEIIQKLESKEMVLHPNHYGGADNPYEAIKVIRAWDLGFDLGNVVKYISRMGKKDLKGDVLESSIEDLKKARFYLDDEIKHMETQLEAIKYQE